MTDVIEAMRQLIIIALLLVFTYLDTIFCVKAQTNCNNLESRKVEQFVFGNCIYIRFASIVTSKKKSYPLINGSVVPKGSKCDEKQQSLELFFKEDIIDGYNASLKLKFNENENYIFMSKLSISVIDRLTEIKFEKDGLNFANSSFNHYYRCKSEQTLTENDICITFSDLELRINDPKFEKKQFECNFDYLKPSLWVRIAVGVCLVGLMVIALVIYFVGRCKSQPVQTHQ